MAVATKTTRGKKTAFENRTSGYVGAIKVNRKGDETSIPVAPGERVFLSDEEIELTEESYARSDRSPFKIREIVHLDPRTGEELARFTAAPLSKVE